MTCPCKFPILLNVGNIPFYALPLEEIEKGLSGLPDIYDYEDDNGNEWVVVKWYDDNGVELQVHDVVGHLVFAGCSKDEITCNSKDVYKVYHPKNEWNTNHVVNVI